MFIVGYYTSSVVDDFGGQLVERKVSTWITDHHHSNSVCFDIIQIRHLIKYIS